MHKKYLSMLMLAGFSVVSSTIFASGWDVALEATESASKRAFKPVEQLPVSGVISSNFGLRQHPITEQVKLHKGIDIAAPLGTEFRSTSTGRVTFSGDAGTLGLMVEIKSVDGTITRFGHASSLAVKAGDRIHKGMVIGQVGSTGLSTGSHLHYEVLVNGKNINPAEEVISSLLVKSPVVRELPSNEASEYEHNSALIAGISGSYQLKANAKRHVDTIQISTAKLLPFATKSRFHELAITKITVESDGLPKEINLSSLESDVSKAVQAAIIAASA